MNFLFIGASNELDAFESGITVALLWMKLFQTLWAVDQMEESG